MFVAIKHTSFCHGFPTNSKVQEALSAPILVSQFVLRTSSFLHFIHF